MSCCAPGCYNRTEAGCPIQFFRFPFGSRIQLNRWLVNIRRKDWSPSPNSRLCSDHFEDDAFTMDSNGVGGVRRLRKSAIPTLFRYYSHSKEAPDGIRRESIRTSLEKKLCCAMCKESRETSKMLEGWISKDISKSFCSPSCVTAYRERSTYLAESLLLQPTQPPPLKKISCGRPIENCHKCSVPSIPKYKLAVPGGHNWAFCSIKCVLSFQEIFNKSNKKILKMNIKSLHSSNRTEQSTSTAKLPCSMELEQLICEFCGSSIYSAPETVENEEKMYVLCGKVCQEAFMRTWLPPEFCAGCKKKQSVSIVLNIEGEKAFFCNQVCEWSHKKMLADTWGVLQCSTCRYCKGLSQSLETSAATNTEEQLCSETCRSAFKKIFQQEWVCDACLDYPGFVQLSLCWLGERKHFCGLDCLLFFCSQHCTKLPRKKESAEPVETLDLTETPTNTTSVHYEEQASVVTSEGAQGADQNLPQLETVQVTDTSTDVLQPDRPRSPKRKNKSCLCRPTGPTRITQTEQSYPGTLVCPLPVPVFVPLPVNLYSQSVPQLLGLPLPVPVPLLLPTAVVEPSKDMCALPGGTSF